MGFGTRVAFEPLREAAFGAITASYVALGRQLTDLTRIITYVNSTDADVYVSYDGTTDHMRFSMSSQGVLDLSANKIRDDGFFLKKGTQIYIKYATAPSMGGFWAEVIYAEGGA